MPSTDIDGTPLFILGADDAVSLLAVLRRTLNWGDIRDDKDAFIRRLKRFCEDPQVVEWLKNA
jgi:hypothetical protein